MSSRARVLVLLALLAGPSTACLDRSSPTITRPDLNTPGVRTPAVEFPALTRPGQDFRPLVPPTGPGQLITRYVLYDDATFALQYLDEGQYIGEYVGTYTRRDSTVNLVWDSDEMVATGTLVGDELRVRYDYFLLLQGWKDETYRRVN